MKNYTRKHRDPFVERPLIAEDEYPDGFRHDYLPVWIGHSYARCLWIVAEKVIEPGTVEFHWVLADRDGNVKDTFTGERKNLPRKFKEYLED
jgi:hypothetical protein